MKELIQARNFYQSLSEKQKNDLMEAIAADLFFLEEELQVEVIQLIRTVDKELGDKIKKENSSCVTE